MHGGIPKEHDESTTNFRRAGQGMAATEIACTAVTAEGTAWGNSMSNAVQADNF
jgi:hypothetical protein